MTNHSTIWMAIDLRQAPSNVKRVRAAPLPKDVSKLMAIAAGDEVALTEAKKGTCRSEQSLREAAGFYIEQILLHPDADHYRVLGARSEASTAELRRNMALLIRWLHPDHKNALERTVFTARVTRAWNELKNEDRRAAYDLTRRRELSRRISRQKRSAVSQGRGSKAQQAPLGLLRRVMISLFGGRVL